MRAFKGRHIDVLAIGVISCLYLLSTLAKPTTSTS